MPRNIRTYQKLINPSIEQLIDAVNEIIEGVNTTSASAERENYKGKPGDIKVNKVSNNEYDFYIRGEDGWHKNVNSRYVPVNNKISTLADSVSDIVDWTIDQGSININPGNYINTEYSNATGSVAGLMSTTHFTKLEAIESNADVTDTGNVTSAGALMDSELTDLAGIKGVTISTLQVKPSEGAFANGDKTKLDGIASNAEVNVQSDWNSSSGDNQILNKPTIPSGNSILDWTADQGSSNIHASNMAAAQTDITSILNSSLKIGRDSGNQISFATDNAIIFKADDETELRLNATTLRPHVNDGLALGNTSYQFSDLHLASGGVINWDNGNTTLTHAAGKLTLNNILEFGSLSDGTITITDFVDEDNMASNSAVKIPTQQSVILSSV